jgi:hypothetical protein
MHYVKLWSNLLKSSILEQDLHVRWLWIAMLLEADRDGNVYGTPEALARVANMNLDQVNAALAILTAPDPNSTTGDEQGRRILPVGTNLWYLVNYQSYRGLKDMEEIRRKTAERVRRHRERKRVQAVTHPVTLDVTQSNPIVLRAEAEAEAEAEAKKKKERGARAPRTGTPFTAPTVKEVKQLIAEKGYHFDAEAFVAKNDELGWTWMQGRTRVPVKDWRKVAAVWEGTEKRSGRVSGRGHNIPAPPITDSGKAALRAKTQEFHNAGKGDEKA